MHFLFGNVYLINFHVFSNFVLYYLPSSIHPKELKMSTCIVSDIIHVLKFHKYIVIECFFCFLVWIISCSLHSVTMKKYAHDATSADREGDFTHIIQVVI